MRKLLSGLASLALLPLITNAQLVADTTSNSPGFSKALSYYLGAVGINASIYSGKENANPRYYINDGSPFFGSDEAVPGDILYGGILYRGIPLWYDIVNNEVAVQHPKMNSRIALNSKNVSYFMLGKHPFVPANRQLPGSERMPDRLYEVLHDGETTLLGLHTKKMFEVIQESQYVTNFSKQQSEYFLQKDGKYYPVKNQTALINLLSDKKEAIQQHSREIQQYIKSSKIKSKETPEQSMVRVLAFYDKIKP